MSRSGRAPEDFGLKVRSHPASLEVTARNKLGTSERVVVNIDLVGKMAETSVVYRDPAPEAVRNRDAIAHLSATLEAQSLQWEPIGGSTGRLYVGVDLPLIRRFLKEWENHDGSSLTQIGPILQHIEDRPGEFDVWDVAFIGTRADSIITGTESTRAPIWSGLGFDLACQVRKPGRTDDVSIEAQKRRFSSRGITRIGMRQDEMDKAEQEFRQKNKDKKNVPDHAYCAHRERPFLALHLIVPRSMADEPSPVPISAWTISFPYSAKEGETVEYLVNTTWIGEYDPADEDELDYDGQ